MEKITFKELEKKFLKHEEKRPEKHLVGYIVYSQKNWNGEKNEEERTYEVSSGEDLFHPFKISEKCYGKNLATGKVVKLNEKWKVDFCYEK